MNIGVIGLGMVGEAVAFGLRRIGHTVATFDIEPKKKSDSYDKVLETQLLFVCVPTPNRNGSCNTIMVEDVVKGLSSKHYAGLVVIKSTIPPGTTEWLHRKTGLPIAFCPEFLRERARFSDFVENHELCIAGVLKNFAVSHGLLIKKAHGSLPKNFVIMSPTEAELAKYFVNCFNAQRIVFANAFYDVCKKLDANYTTIKDAVTKRSGIESNYLTCNEQTREFGGSCLPKDTEAFASFVKEQNLRTEVFAQIVAENNWRLAERVRHDQRGTALDLRRVAGSPES